MTNIEAVLHIKFLELRNGHGTDATNKSRRQGHSHTGNRRTVPMVNYCYVYGDQ